MNGYLIDTNVLSETLGQTLDGIRHLALEQWIEHDLRNWFPSRLLPVTKTIADRWGVLAGQSKLKGKALTMADGLILATAFEHDLVIVTRNAKDFAGYGASLFNPWES